MLPEQQQRILGYFIEEAKDHLNTLEQGLLNLQSTIDDREMLKEVYRAAHSVKGGAGMLSLQSIQKTSHLLEDCFKLLEEAPVRVDQKLESLLWLVFDTLKDLLEHLQGPFGLADDVAAKLMSTVEPVFTELTQHLETLVNTSRKGTGAKQRDSQQELVASAYKQEVMEQLRQMLQLFKPPAWPNSRPQLEGCCDNLANIGDRFGLSSWCNLMAAAKLAIANPENTCQTLAPIIIKEIKAAQELVLASRGGEIAPSEQLQALLPILPSEEPEAFSDSTDLDLFSLGDDEDKSSTEDNFEFDSPFSDSNASNLEPDLDLFDDIETEESKPETYATPAANPGKRLSRTAPNTYKEFPETPHIVGSADPHGPEVGAAELNTLADLFEEAVDFDDTWQEEQTISEATVEPTLNLVNDLDLQADSDFADLFDEVSSIGQGSESDDPLSLFGDAFIDEEESNQNGATDDLTEFTSIGATTEKISPNSADNLAELFSDFQEEDPHWEELETGDWGGVTGEDSAQFNITSENELETQDDRRDAYATGGVSGEDSAQLQITSETDDFDESLFGEAELTELDEASFLANDKRQNADESLEDIFSFEEDSDEFWSDRSEEPAATAQSAELDKNWLTEVSLAETSSSGKSTASRSQTDDLADIFDLDSTATARQVTVDVDAFSSKDGYEELSIEEQTSSADFSFDANWDLSDLENTPATEQAESANWNDSEDSSFDDLFANPFAIDSTSITPQKSSFAEENLLTDADLTEAKNQIDTSSTIDDLFDLGLEETGAFGSESLDFEGDDLFGESDLFGTPTLEESTGAVGIAQTKTSPANQINPPTQEYENDSDLFGEEQGMDWFADISSEESLEMFEPLAAPNSQQKESNFIEELAAAENDLQADMSFDFGTEEDSSEPWLELEAADATQSLDANQDWQGMDVADLSLDESEDNFDEFGLSELSLTAESTEGNAQNGELLDEFGLALDESEDNFDDFGLSELSLTAESTEGNAANGELLDEFGLSLDESEDNFDEFGLSELSLTAESTEGNQDWQGMDVADLSLDESEDGFDEFGLSELSLTTESADGNSENGELLDEFGLSLDESEDKFDDFGLSELSLTAESTEGNAENGELLDEFGLSLDESEDNFDEFGLSELSLTAESTEGNAENGELLDEFGLSLDESEDNFDEFGLSELSLTAESTEGNQDWQGMDVGDLSLETVEDNFDEFSLDELSLTTADGSTGEIEATSETLDFDTGIGEFDELEAMLGEEVPGGETAQLDELSEFDALEAMLGEELPASSPAAVSAADSAELEDFSDLEALLGDEAPPAAKTATAAAAAAAVAGLAVAAGAGATSQKSDDLDFGDLEKMMAEVEKTQGAPASKPKSQAATPRRLNRGFLEQTMKVPVKHMDNLSNLVGELVVNRNTLEQEQERQRQFLDNLLNQVQQLSDVGARMQDLYERSLLEASLLASRQSYRSSSSYSDGGSSSRRHSSGAEFDPTELDRFTRFHELAQDMIELIVRVRESTSDIEFVTDETDQVCRQFRQISTQLQEGLTRARMVPFGEIERVFPLMRYVRDKAAEFGKQAELKIEGRDTLMDKLILEHFSDPLKHLVNNAIAHGIETPEVRQKAGKSPTGRITIRAFHQGNQTVISFSDDGGGINVERVRAKAIEKRLITPSEAKSMSRQEVYQLIYHPGFSTKDEADLLAGKGVGMDVVLTSLSEIRGSITTDSTEGKGTTFTIRLPLTLSICKALCCLSDKARIAFPMDGVEDALDIPIDRIQVNTEGEQCFPWRDSLLPFRPLSELLTYNRQIGRAGVYGGTKEEDVVSIVVLRSPGSLIALQVDQVLGEQEIVIKQLEGPIPKPLGIAGATVQGDGRIMPIADVLELVDLSMGRIRNEGGKLWDQDATQVPEQPKTEPTVLIVDDSITVRELLSMTFNKAGYRVEQARDGQEAWDKLKSGLPCEIVFCDIEMPRMDGLELLGRLQKDPDLNHLPVAMLTSRGAEKHRQTAVQLGASGYFTKPYLEESLLDAASRMLKGEKLVTSNV